MNPHAKEFVPAHLVKRRQDESELTEQIGRVGIDEPKESATRATMTTTTTTIQNNQTTTTESRPATKSSENGDTNSCSGDSNIKHHHTNGIRPNPENESDRYLLRGGEAFCEFNGEQFIIPGEDEEYAPQETNDQDSFRKASFDFGNPEDNEDEDVCNAYEQFLDNLPE